MKFTTGAALLAGLMAFPLTIRAADSARPSWCPKGWECIKTEEMVADAEYHLNLREQVLKYKARASRFGLTIGPGLGVGGVVDENFSVRYVPVGGVFIVWGLRF